MVIYFLRHASAGESLSNPKKDERRALDRGGIEQCGYIGRALAAMDVHVDMIATSPLKRAAQTASLVGNELAGRVISVAGCEAAVELKKGAVAKLEMGRNSAVLQWCLTPKIVKTLHAGSAESSRPKTSRK